MARGLVLAAALLCPGCFWFTTKHEGKELRRDVGDLQTRVSKQEQSVDAKVKQLDESLAKATKVLAVNSADLGAEVQKMSAEVAALTGQIENLRREVDGLQKDVGTLRSDSQTMIARIDAIEKKATSGAPADKDGLWASAQQKLQERQYEPARRELRVYVQRYPQDAKADDAQFAIGDSYLKEKQYENAIREFQRVIDSYASSELADDAFYAAGNAAADMKWCTDARAYLGALQQRHPKSPFNKEAKKKLDYLKKQAKNKSVCQM
jgi:TolA-binding protein